MVIHNISKSKYKKQPTNNNSLIADQKYTLFKILFLPRMLYG